MSATAGGAAPLGATPDGKGTNFSVFSRHGTGVELLLFDRVDDAKAARTIRLDAAGNRTYCYWHAFVPDVAPGQVYAYRVEGPADPSAGCRFDPAKVLLDPYGRAVAVPERYDRDAARMTGDNAATAMKSVVVDPSDYDWEGDGPLRTDPTLRVAIRAVVELDDLMRRAVNLGTGEGRGAKAGERDVRLHAVGCRHDRSARPTAERHDRIASSSQRRRVERERAGGRAHVDANRARQYE